jgi:hypothetical protein
MTAGAVLQRLVERDFVVAARDGRLVVTPASRLTDADRELIRRHRDEMLTLVTPDLPVEDWLARFLGRDVVPARAVIAVASAAGYWRAEVIDAAKQVLLEQTGPGGKKYWSRPWSPHDLAELARGWRERAESTRT